MMVIMTHDDNDDHHESDDDDDDDGDGGDGDDMMFLGVSDHLRDLLCLWPLPPACAQPVLATRGIISSWIRMMTVIRMMIRMIRMISDG